MNNYLTAIKDFALLLSPILIAYINYRSNKKSEKDIRLEIEKSLKERDAETSQAIMKLSAEIEGKKQLAVWNNSLPQTDEYTKLAGAERYGNICSISALVSSVNNLLDSGSLTNSDLCDLKSMLTKIELPIDEEKLYPYEIPYLLSYKQLIKKVDSQISSCEINNSSESTL